MIYVVGQNYPKIHERAWDIQGVFSTEEKAEDACLDESFFIFEMTVDEKLPEKSGNYSRYKFPKIENIWYEPEDKKG